MVAAITRGGFAQASTATPAATLATGAFSADPTAGDLVVVGAMWERDTNEVVSGVADNASGNTFSLAAGSVLLDAFGLRIYYAMNVNTTTGYSATGTWSGGNFAAAAVAGRAYSGAATSSALDLATAQQQAGVAATTDAISSGSLGTPSTDGQLVFAMTRGSGGIIDSLTAGTSFTALVAHGGGTAFLFEDYIQTTAAPVAGTFTCDNAGRTWDTSAATFKAAAGASAAPFESDPTPISIGQPYQQNIMIFG